MSKQYHNEEFKKDAIKHYKSGKHANVKYMYKQTAKQQKKQSHPFKHQ